LIRETESGWVVCLTYRGADFDATTPGGRPDALPFYAVHDGEGSYRDRVADADGREDSLRGAIYEAAVALEPMDALGDPDHPVIGATYGTFTRERLVGAWPTPGRSGALCSTPPARSSATTRWGSAAIPTH